MNGQALTRALLTLVLLISLFSGLAPRAVAAYEGFGATTPGGAGKPIYYVTNLNNSGPGSLRDAVSQGNRTVQFRVAGDIVLSDYIYVTGAFITIDGLSAPSPGITLRNRGLIIRGNRGAHDVIVRGIRVRGSAIDGFQVAYGAYNVVLDHVSAAGSGDGNIDITEGSHDVTVSWSIIAGTNKNMLVKYNPARVTLHHNLFVQGQGRNPQVRIDDANGVATDTTADVRNNVVTGWGNGYGTIVWYGPRANVVNNYYDRSHEAITVTSARAFVQGNVAGDGVNVNGVGNESSAFPAPAVVTQAACTAAIQVLAGAGVRPLDVVDAQFLSQVTPPSCQGSGQGSATLTVTPGELGFEASVGGLALPSAGLAITNGGAGTLNWTSKTATSNGGAWLSVSPASGTGAATLTVEADPEGLSEGIYHGTVTVTATGAAGSPRLIPVTLVVESPNAVETAQIRVASGADDGREYDSGDVNTTATSHFPGSGRFLALRFRSVPVPPGSTIHSAVLELYSVGDATRSISLRYSGEAVGDSAPLTTAPWNFSHRLRTEAFVDDTPGPWQLSQYNPSPDLSAIIQEIVNHPDWLAGNDLTVFVANHGSAQNRYIGSFETSASPTRAPVLTITYGP